MNIRLAANHKLGVMALAFMLLGTAIQSHAQEPAAPIIHGVPFKTGIQSASAPAGSHLTYYGGPVITNVQVRLVLWGPNTNPALASTLPGFYTGITNSIFFDMFSEYATNVTPAGGGTGTNQSIGRGSYVGASTITPSTTSTNLTDPQIQSELVAQINAGHIPQPAYDLAGNVVTEYMIYFPPGVHISSGGSPSCAAGGFCAYHGTILFNNKYMPYSVIPDFGPGSGCDTGCGTGSQIQNVESASSHELIETVTDIGVGFASVFAPPLAWYDPTNGEIGDICNGKQSVISTPNGTYTVQQEFSNAAANCVVTGLHPKFSVTSAASTPGTPFALTVTAQNPATGTHTSFAGTVHFTSTDSSAVLPANYTFVPSDKGVHVFNVTLTTPGSSVTATDTVNSAITGTVTPATGSGFTLTAAPATKTIGQGDFAPFLVTETATGGFSSPITLSVTGLPAGATSGFTVNPFTSGSSAMYIVTRPTTTIGSYPLTITGTSGAITRTVGVTMVVTAHGPVDFSFSVAPATRTVTRGNSATYTLTETPAGGFSGAVTPLAVNVPAGATATFAPSPFTGSTTATIATTASTPVGTYQIILAGYSGSLLHTIPVTLIVQ